MKSKRFVPSPPPKHYTNDKKTADYWGMLFISIILLSSMSCFLFANHGDRLNNRLSLTTPPATTQNIDSDQNG